jgi:hypothetical protein
LTPNNSWIKTRSIIGVMNDVGVYELIEIEKEWYFV